MTTLITKDEMLEMAIKCGWNNPANNMAPLYEFAKLVAQHEREACAKVCDELSKKHSWEGCYANECAEEIRARGNNT